MAAEKKLQLTSYSRMLDSIESRAEKLLKFVENFDAEKMDKSILEDKLESVDEMRSLFHETEAKLFGVIKEEEIEEWQMTIEKVEDTFDEIRHLIRHKLRSLDPPKPAGAVPAVANAQSTQPKLPDIPLPRFTGQLEDWLVFKTQFTALIKRRDGLSDSEKLFYLKASIQDGAARHVQSSEDSFLSLWKALCNEFENKRTLVDKHIAQLFQLKPISRESGSALRCLINDVTKNIRALANLELKIEPLSEQFLIHLTCVRLDPRTRKDFELQLTDNALPTWDKLLEFLQSRCRCLERIEQEGKEPPSSHSSRLEPERSGTHVAKSSSESFQPQRSSYGNVTCFVCKGAHFLNRCEQFLNLPPNDRFSKIKSLGICINCFSNKHFVHDCKGSSCRKCGRRHHTLLHESDSVLSSQPNDTRRQTEPNSSARSNAVPPHSSTNSVVGTVSSSAPRTSQYILYTAVVLVEDVHGNTIECRILLDCGSMHNIVTSRIANSMKLPKKAVNVCLEGVSGTPQPIKNKVRATIRSTTNPAISYNLEFLVMNKITSDLPIKSFPIEPGRIPADVALADPTFNRSRRIDMLLGIQVFNELFTGQTFSLTDDQTFWCKETVFGWVVGGAVTEQEAEHSSKNFSAVVTNEDLGDQISRFWEMESFPEPRRLTPDEQAAEQSFTDTCRRLPDGRYEVGLPVKESIRGLGDSQTMAMRRFVQIERRLIHDPNLYEQYRAFMSDYHEQGHMIKTNRMFDDGYFLPHHAVFNPASTTTKTRVVFDASAVTAAGSSLNDHLFVGPILQRKLMDIILRFRVPKFAFTADITQMFRQIMIRPADRVYQQIFWRPSPDQNLEVFQLATVTYGTACAPFLATRTLEQLCKDEAERFPLASKAGTEDFYMDDCLSGADTLDEAIALQAEFTEMMASGGFTLHKWASNHPALLASVPNSDSEQVAFFEDEKTTRTLGLTWQPRKDIFLTKLNEISFYSGPPTKRSVYSDIAKLYDPLGLLGPLTFAAKVQLQKLWQLEVEWDELLTAEAAEGWTTFRNQLTQMGEIEIPRCVLPHFSPRQVELHGFSDASELGYGACVYIRSVDNDDNCSVTLLTSKSRIAPLKNAKPTIPRLELCGTLVLARLISNIIHNMNITFSRINLWSDSTTALSWIKTDPLKLKTFVCNRVIEIQDLTKGMIWRYVGTHDNPADALSRGLQPSEIRENSLWWTGPSFLYQNEAKWPRNIPHTPAEQLPETKNLTINLTVTDPHVEPKTFNLFLIESKFRKMQRTMVVVLRFIDHIRVGQRREHRYGAVTVRELDQATLALISIAQREAFPNEISHLEAERPIHSKSKLITLSVFLDRSRYNVLRVGGRIRHAALAAGQRHPLVLPSDHPLTEAVIRAFHTELLHAPQQLLLNALRRRFWVMHGGSSVRKVLRRCVTCFKAKPVTMQQMMGDLPKSRLEGVYPFLNAGVDFCGPVYIRQHNKRSTITYKAYIAVFLCFATRAIHLELVGDLTADSFIAALERFVSRRGVCAKLFSDNGLNFVGSKTKLKQMADLFQTQLFKAKLDEFCTTSAIEWHLIPPHAPHFGGLWEAGVRSAKYHLKRVTGTANMNFEEYSTVLARIEAVLNSRPITALSEDPDDDSPLSPGHFLVGRPLTAIAEPDLTTQKATNLSRWQRHTLMVQHFWARWSKDYITTLQSRNKWHERFPVTPGQLVIIRDDNLPAMLWKLGRIEAVFPGPDGLVRVADVRTKGKVIRRPITKLCLVPIQANTDQHENDPQLNESDDEQHD